MTDPEVFRTKSGRVLTDADFERLADEAEAGLIALTSLARRIGRREYGVRSYGGHIEAKISMHVATLEVQERLAKGEKNVWRVSRTVTDWERDDPVTP